MTFTIYRCRKSYKKAKNILLPSPMVFMPATSKTNKAHCWKTQQRVVILYYVYDDYVFAYDDYVND